MAGIASLPETLLRVIGIVGVLIILQMAANAGFAGEVEVAIGMALAARQRRVRAGQREPYRIVVEGCRLPGGRGVALLAGLRQPKLNVVGVIGLLEVWQMAAHAGCRSAFELVIKVTLVALQGGVGAGKSKAGEFQMVEVDAEPGVHRMALFAGGGKPGRRVRRASSLLIVLGVAGVALGG
jgi:hypothetical protein